MIEGFEHFDHVDPEDLRALEESTKLERTVFSEKSGADLAQSILEDAAPAAAASIVQIATKDPNSRVRLTASQYIIDRALGKSGNDPAKAAPWADVFAAVTVNAEVGK